MLCIVTPCGPESQHISERHMRLPASIILWYYGLVLKYKEGRTVAACRPQTTGHFRCCLEKGGGHCPDAKEAQAAAPAGDFSGWAVPLLGGSP